MYNISFAKNRPVPELTLRQGASFSPFFLHFLPKQGTNGPNRGVNPTGSKSVPFCPGGAKVVVAAGSNGALGSTGTLGSTGALGSSGVSALFTGAS